MVATQAHSLTLDQCTRVTHISHGGEAGHIDLGDGRVMWRDWWSQEGTATNLVIMDCEVGRMLDVRTAETNMHPTRTDFDRTDDAMEVIALHESGARVFATFERMAVDLDRIGRDLMISQPTDETCACAALYPAFQDGKEPFSLPE